MIARYSGVPQPLPRKHLLCTVAQVGHCDTVAQLVHSDTVAQWHSVGQYGTVCATWILTNSCYYALSDHGQIYAHVHKSVD